MRTIHSIPSVALATVDASPPRTPPGELVRLALLACPAPVVARRLRCSPELVRGWVGGKSLPNLRHMLDAPAFGRRLVVLAGEQIDVRSLVQHSPREALGLLLCTLGGLLLATQRPLPDLPAEEVKRIAEQARDAAEQAADLARLAEAELLRRRNAGSKGVDHG